jgi:uncharacterized membrane protein YtjA (UPF0391 family)
MLSWSVSFLIIALIAAFFGWSGVATAAAGTAQILFYLFLVAFIISMVASVVGHRGPTSTSPR